MNKLEIKPGVMARRIGDIQFGKVIHVEDGYATVDYRQSNGEIRTAYVPVTDLEIEPWAPGEKRGTDSSVAT